MDFPKRILCEVEISLGTSEKVPKRSRSVGEWLGRQTHKSIIIFLITRLALPS